MTYTVTHTFGTGGYMFRKKALAKHFGNEGTWIFSKDFVPGLAGMNYLRNKNDIIWKKIPKGYVHGFPVYVKYHILGISKKYFKDNAVKIIGK